MARFFMAGCNAIGGIVLLTGADAEHVRVLRLRVGDHIVVCDGAGTDRRCKIRRFTAEGCEAEVEETVPNKAEPTVRVTVLAGLPKQPERSDFTVQKCTECGAQEIIFFRSRRCISAPTKQGLEKRLARMQRIAEEAAKQCGRGIVPRVSAVCEFAGALEAAKKTELPLLLYETGERVPLRAALEGAGSFSSAAILTGPEGGFEPYEAELARKLGFRVCSMGPRILRCETAPVAALTALMYATDNLN